MGSMGFETEKGWWEYMPTGTPGSSSLAQAIFLQCFLCTSFQCSFWQDSLQYCSTLHCLHFFKAVGSGWSQPNAKQLENLPFTERPCGSLGHVTDLIETANGDLGSCWRKADHEKVTRYSVRLLVNRRKSQSNYALMWAKLLRTLKN